MAQKETYEEAERRMLRLQGMSDEAITAYFARRSERIARGACTYCGTVHTHEAGCQTVSFA